MTASVESHSEHPLGKAIVAYAKDMGLSVQAVDDFQMIPGKGIRANIDGKQVLCGNSQYLLDSGIIFNADVAVSLEKFQNQGKAAVLVSGDGMCLGIIALSDTIRADAKDMVKDLYKANTDAVLITGDHERTAKYYAKEVGIDEIYAELLPAQKVERIKTLQEQGRPSTSGKSMVARTRFENDIFSTNSYTNLLQKCIFNLRITYLNFS
jgi:P-type E1-E2 ATPase